MEQGIRNTDHKSRNTEHWEPKHHAYLVKGGEDTKERVFEILEKDWEISTKGNPDFVYLKSENFSVSDARSLKGLQEKRSFDSKSKKVFVIDTDSVAVEAQNSLLKTFEEPALNTFFFILGSCVNNLIPTLLSRLSVMEIDGEDDKTTNAKKFLALSMADRFAFVKKLADEIKDEKKIKSEALDLLNGIEREVYGKFESDKSLSVVLSQIETCRNFLTDRSASIKMVLEHVSMIV